jgi:hypothetical protein
MMTSALIVLFGAAASALGGWLYFGRYEMVRPPIGVSGLADVAFAFVAIIIVPILYLVLPTWFVAGLLILTTFSLIYFLLEPVLPRLLVWAISALLVVGDLVAGWQLGMTHPFYLAINNLIVILSVVSIANAWASSGTKARDAAVLGGVLILYDFIATAQLSMMGDLFTRLSGLPLAPILAWGEGGTYAAIGLGDLMMLTLFPLTMWKGYGLRAGAIALGIGFVALVLLFVLPITTIFPVMVLLGPLMLVQYLWWRRTGPERRWKEFRPVQKMQDAA